MSINVIPEGQYQVSDGPTEKELVVTLLQNRVQWPELLLLSFRTEAGCVTIEVISSHREGLDHFLYGMDGSGMYQAWIWYDPFHRTGDLILSLYYTFD